MDSNEYYKSSCQYSASFSLGSSCAQGVSDVCNQQTPSDSGTIRNSSQGLNYQQASIGSQSEVRCASAYTAPMPQAKSVYPTDSEKGCLSQSLTYGSGTATVPILPESVNNVSASPFAGSEPSVPPLPLPSFDMPSNSTFEPNTASTSAQAPPPSQSSPTNQPTMKNFETKESVMRDILEIELCDIPLRKHIFEVNRSAEVDCPTRKITYHDYVKLETSPTLHQIEVDKLEELKNACVLLRSPYKQVVNETNHLGDALKVTEAAIRRLIKMSKRLAAFNRLSQNDQIGLLKNSIIEMMCIRATTNFNSEHNFWYFIDDKNKGLTVVSMEVLTTAQVNLLSHKNFAIKFNSQFRNDTMIADLLTAIILFRPSRATNCDQEIVRDEFLNYCYLLRRYLQVKYNSDSCEAKSAFIVLMHRLEELYYLSEDIVRIYLDMDPENAGPLFVELFDLK